MDQQMMDAWALLASGHNSEDGRPFHRDSDSVGPVAGSEVLRGLNQPHQRPLGLCLVPTRTVDRTPEAFKG